MRVQKSAYELARSQVETPEDVVRFVWKLNKRYRSTPGTILDLGAGDGRFATCGKYASYLGVEIDRGRVRNAKLPQHASMRVGCAFTHRGGGYDLCVGNPPYVRHHDLDETWRDRIAARLSKATGKEINRKSNLYVYFITLGLLKTAPDGLVSVVVPYEWASRPSASALRGYIEANDWHVDIYRFADNIFGNVLTTASVSIIDKRNRDGKWRFFDVDANRRIRKHREVTLSAKSLLPYERRGPIWAMRGMSPGTQSVFTLTEGERIHAGLSLDDVLPCVTTLRHISDTIQVLNRNTFRRCFIDAGERCWLIQSHKPPSTRLQRYLDHVSPERRATWTCTNRDPWFSFDLHPCPRLLVATGFVEHGPKAVVNTVGAYAVGSVCGIHTDKPRLATRRLRQFLLGVDFEKRVVSHSGELKKIEIRQLNAVLNRFSARWCHE